MFKHDFQGGPCFEVFSAQEKSPLTHWKLTGGIKKLFDKEVKSYVYNLEGAADKTRMQLPNDIKRGLSLFHSFLVLQIYIHSAQDFAIDLGFLHGTSQRRRLALSTAYRETKSTEIHCQIPVGLVKRSMWLNLCVNMADMVVKAWPDMTYQSLESICVSGSCKLRRIFTMRRQAPDTTTDEDLYGVDVNTDVELESIPKQCQLPPDVAQQTQVVNWLKVKQFESFAKAAKLTDATGSNLSQSSSDNTKYHIAFGSKVPGAVVQKSAFKEGSASVSQVHKRSNSDVNSADNSSSSAPHSAESVLTVSDPSDELPQFVQPHPPQVPSSSNASRRRPRVRSAGHDRTPLSVNGLQAQQAAKVEIVATEEEVENIMSTLQKKSHRQRGLPSESESETSGASSHAGSWVAADDSDESITDVINALKEERSLQPAITASSSGEDSEGGRVYYYSSRPRVPKSKSQIGRVVRTVSDSNVKRSTAGSGIKQGRDEASDDESELDARRTLENSLPTLQVTTKDDAGQTTLTVGNAWGISSSPTKQSVLRSSLREIPAEEVRRSGGVLPYHHRKYQSDELSESCERQMLREMQEEAANEGESYHAEKDFSTLTRENVSKLDDHLPIGTLLDSSDEEISTLKSPNHPSKYQHHDYSDEIACLQKNFLRASFPSEMDSTYSPRIDSPSGSMTFDAANTMELPTLSTGRHSDVRASAKFKAVEPKGDDGTELELMYDAELQVFWDPKTFKYYKFKMPNDSQR